MKVKVELRAHAGFCYSTLREAVAVSDPYDERLEKIEAILDGLNALPEWNGMAVELKRISAEAILAALSNAGFIVSRRDDAA